MIITLLFIYLSLLHVCTTYRTPIDALSDPCDSYIVYYSEVNHAALEKLKQFKVVILDPREVTKAKVDELHEAGVVVLGYLAVMEDNMYGRTPRAGDECGPVYYDGEDRIGENLGVASFYFDIDQDGEIDTHPLGSYIVDPASQVWINALRFGFGRHNSWLGGDEIIHTLGFDGLFLDTVTDASPYSAYNFTLYDMALLIQEISSWYSDDIYIVLNNAIFFAADENYADLVRPHISGIVWECFYSQWSWEYDEGVVAPSWEGSDTRWQELITQQSHMEDGYSVMTLDYFRPYQTALIAKQFAMSTMWGWNDYVTTITLDEIRFDTLWLCDKK